MTSEHEQKIHRKRKRKSCITTTIAHATSLTSQISNDTTYVSKKLKREIVIKTTKTLLKSELVDLVTGNKKIADSLIESLVGMKGQYDKVIKNAICCDEKIWFDCLQEKNTLKLNSTIVKIQEERENVAEKKAAACVFAKFFMDYNLLLPVRGFLLGYKYMVKNVRREYIELRKDGCNLRANIDKNGIFNIMTLCDEGWGPERLKSTINPEDNMWVLETFNQLQTLNILPDDVSALIASMLIR